MKYFLPLIFFFAACAVTGSGCATISSASSESSTPAVQPEETPAAENPLHTGADANTDTPPAGVEKEPQPPQPQPPQPQPPLPQPPIARPEPVPEPELEKPAVEPLHPLRNESDLHPLDNNDSRAAAAAMKSAKLHEEEPEPEPTREAEPKIEPLKPAPEPEPKVKPEPKPDVKPVLRDFSSEEMLAELIKRERKLVSDDPANIDAQMRLGALLRMSGQPEKSEQVLRRLPEEGGLSHRLERALTDFELGNYTEL